jgi:pyruvate,water dikinase
VQQQKTYRQQVLPDKWSLSCISGIDQLLDAIHGCYVSLFTNRAIKYRHDMGFTKLDIAISVGVQQMVRSDKASSGVAFTIDPDTGFQNTIIINGGWGWARILSRAP